MPYNPQRLTQRIGRCRRIGQKWPVQVTNIIMENSIEERILEIIYEKRKLFDDIIGPHTQEIVMNEQMIREIFE